MFTWTLVDLEYETRVSIWEFEMVVVLKCKVYLHFSLLQIKFTKHKWNWIY